MCATFCEGCGLRLGFRKYRFTRLWQIPGVYCRKCMIKLGKNFENSAAGAVTFPKLKCAGCENEFYFLSKKENNLYCHSCFQAIANNVPPPRQRPESAPVAVEPVRQINQNYGAAHKYVLFVGGTGVIFLIAGLVFTFYFAANDPTVFTFLYGSVPGVMGLILLRKAIKTRSVFLAKH